MRQRDKRRRDRALATETCLRHAGVKAVKNKRLCRQCYEYMECRRKRQVANGFCQQHSKVRVSQGRTLCQACLDRRAVNGLPVDCREAAKNRADATRRARMNGAYRCPALGLSEAEIMQIFPKPHKRAFWQFDHTALGFRDIISRQANLALGSMPSYLLKRLFDYARGFERRSK